MIRSSLTGLVAAMAILPIAARCATSVSERPVCAGEVRLSPMGRMQVVGADVQFVPTVFYPGWISRTPTGGYRPEHDGSRRWSIPGKGHSASGSAPAFFTGRTYAAATDDGGLSVDISMESAVAVTQLLGGCVSVKLPCGRYAGGWAVADGRRFSMPKVRERSGSRIFSGAFRSIVLFDAGENETLSFAFPSEARCMLQDDREWSSDTLSLRLFFAGLEKAASLDRGERRSLSFTIRTPHPISFSPGEFVISESDEWVRLDAKTEMIPGSALDFSGMGFQDAPAGKHGWLAVKDGHFEFEGLPGVRQRFYGVNLVGEANYPPAKDAEGFVQNLVRVGYNAVRFHHHDQGLSKGKDGSLDPQAMERFDAMVAACIRHGVYITTDLYVSRRVAYRDMGIDRPGCATHREFKDLVETNEGAYRNFQRYARAFLEHVNPHTGRRYADEPAMPLLSLVNEGNSASLFTPDLERSFARRTVKWLREEIRARALLTNMNMYSYPEEFDSVRADEYDYLDNHFYADHPRFLERKWSLPSTLPNRNPLRCETHGLYRVETFRSRIKKPMPHIVTEFNFSGPGQYRAVGGIETGASAAMLGYDGLWRFAWSHGIEGVYGPKAMTYFDMSGDPLSLAGERAALCLFLRGDMRAGDASALRENRETGSMTVETSRTCGGFAEGGEIAAGPLRATLDGTAAIWASSLDGRPLAGSGRMLLSHITDVQNSGMAYADSTRTVLLKWGAMPHLARRGKAEVRLRCMGPCQVHALDFAGARRCEIPCGFDGHTLSFEADVARDRGNATFFYEIVRRE